MKENLLRKATPAAAAGLLVFALGCTTPGPEMAPVPETVVVAVPSPAGAVDDTSQNSDEFIWNLFTQFTAPVSETSSAVVFETWASDADTFSKTPHWPDPDEARKFQMSVLSRKKNPHPGPIDVACVPPGNAAVGGFPRTGTPQPCIAEEVKRNRPQFDYIVDNNLNTKAGLAEAFASSFDVEMPTSALSVKVDWVPVQTMLQWIPELQTVERIGELYHTTVSDNVEYALVSVHVSSRQNRNWVWGTFEHQMNPGRCDDIGCFDTFGATIPAVLPNRFEVNTQYGACPKTQALLELMAEHNLATVWENYCMKSTQVDYSAADGTPYVLGNSVIEGITGNGTIAASSCIACHAYASFGEDGTTTCAAEAMLHFNPTGPRIPGVLDGSLKFDFMWGVLLAPPRTSQCP